MVVGTIKSYNANKGWGFVENNGKDVFVQHKELGGRIVKEGDKISFTITQGDKGAQATKIKVMGAATEAKYKGEVKSFVWTKGYGFITSDAFPGQDIFFMKTNVSEQARDCVQKGGWCTFKLGEDAGKGPTATDIFLIGAAGNAVKNRGGQGQGGGNDQLVSALVQALVGGGGKGGGKGIVCHKCGKPGHKSPDCYQGGGGGGGGFGFGIVCHTCGKPGHKSPDCYQKLGVLQPMFMKKGKGFGKW